MTVNNIFYVARMSWGGGWVICNTNPNHALATTVFSLKGGNK